MRGAPFELEVGTRHARPDKRALPAALGPNEMFSLSVIASMAHSTFKSGAATQDSVAFGYQLKIWVNNTQPRSRLSCLCQIRQRMSPIYAHDPLRMD